MEDYFKNIDGEAKAVLCGCSVACVTLTILVAIWAVCTAFCAYQDRVAKETEVSSSVEALKHGYVNSRDTKFLWIKAENQIELKTN